ncbi:MAG: hypothetical protein K8I29_14405 [Alphaproteobacteria bacterium]|uniref:Uncharacterized protein n=1 Tax=Candidatus Nitrobium versatile TaxID=2884831 RepID=A0A953JGB8_9BACT|nr:hypothetical protein [Candidatus Nitrobium versatile]
MEMENREQIVQAVKEAAAALESAKESLAAVRCKQESVTSSIPGLKEALVQAKQAKEKALEGFVRDKVSLEALEKAKKAFNKTAQEEADAMEMVEYLEDAVKEAEGDVNKARVSLEAARKKLHGFELERIKTELSEIGPKVVRAYAALTRHKGGGYIFSGCLSDILSIREPQIEEQRELWTEIESEYGLSGIEWK